MAPLLLAGSKLYLTTAEYRRKYYDYVLDAGDWMEVRLGLSAIKMERDQIAGFDILRL